MNEDERFEQASRAILLLIAEVAKKKGISHTQIGEQVGWPATHVSRALTAQHFPTLPKVLQLAGSVGLKLFFNDENGDADLDNAFEKAMDELGRRPPKNLN